MVSSDFSVSEMATWVGKVERGIQGTNGDTSRKTLQITVITVGRRPRQCLLMFQRTSDYGNGASGCHSGGSAPRGWGGKKALRTVFTVLSPSHVTIRGNKTFKLENASQNRIICHKNKSLVVQRNIRDAKIVGQTTTHGTFPVVLKETVTRGEQ